MSRHILVADDSATIQKVIKIAFSRYDVQLEEAGSLVEALSKARPSLDLMIVDASLPGANQAEDFQKLHKKAGERPMLLLRGTYEKVDESALKDVGLDTFLSKPFESRDIVGIADQLLDGGLENGAVAPEGSGGVVPPIPSVGGPDGDPKATHYLAPTAGPSETLQTTRKSVGTGTPGDVVTAGPVPTPKLQTDQDRKGKKAFDAAATPSSSSLPAAPDFHPTQPPEGGVPAPAVDFDAATQPASTSGKSSPSKRNLSPPPPPIPGPRHTVAGSTGTTSPPPPVEPSEGAGSERPASSSTEKDSWGTEWRPTGDLGNMDFQVDAPDSPSDGSDIPPPPMGGLPHIPDSTDIGFGAAKGRLQDETAAGDPGSSDWMTTGQQLSDIIDEKLPTLVKKAVEDYCDRHFKSLAREIITQELRRLADEKARHLVDN